MLTAPDGSTDGRLLAYLCNPRKYRDRDPELFDWLKQVVGCERDRRTARIEGSALLGSVSFQSRILTDSYSERREYFSECATRFGGCDIVFFDPDTGLEIKSTPRGRKDSCKYLYWNEVSKAFTAASSVLIYQHYPREHRAGYIARLARALLERTHAARVFSFGTPNVLFLLASQERHVAAFRERVSTIRSGWGPSEIVAAEHPELLLPT